MKDRAFRLDFFIAIAAVLISAVTAGALIYQTRVIGDQFSATIWPYLSVGATYDPGGETIEVANDGVGPALVRSAQLSVDGKTVRSWNDYLAVMTHDPVLLKMLARALAVHRAGTARSTISMSSIGPGSTLRPGESQTLLRISLPVIVPPAALARHSLALEFCYCSLNASCWTLHATPSQMSADPAPIPHCPGAAAIQSHAASLPAPPAVPMR